MAPLRAIDKRLLITCMLLAGIVQILNYMINNNDINLHLFFRGGVQVPSRKIERIDDKLDNEDEYMVLYNYSLTITPELIESYKAALPPLMANYKNPCWVEYVPEGYSYDDNFYMRIRADEDHMSTCPHFGEAKHFDKMKSVLQTRCTKTRSPCWRVRCFPYFFVLGSTKSGTSNLYTTLTYFHPQILKNTRKESQFWARGRHAGQHECAGPSESATFADFVELYDWTSEQIRTNVNEHNGTLFHPQIIGEYSPSNYYQQHSWQTWGGNVNQSEPRVILAHLLYHIRPETKFIFNMREPIARAVSNHYMRVRYDRANDTVDMILENYLTRAVECLANRTASYCVYSFPHNMVMRGMYGVFMKDWLKVFPREQFYFLQFEQYIANKLGVVNDIVRFLELDPLPKEAVEVLRNDPLASSHPGNEQPKLELMEKLKDFYRPWNQQLSDLLGDDKYLWDY